MSNEQFVSIAEAAKLVGRSRVTIYRDYVNTGKLSVHVNGSSTKKVSISELIRVFGPLLPPSQVAVTPEKLNTALQHETSKEAFSLLRELDALKAENALLLVKLEAKDELLRRQDASFELVSRCVNALPYKPIEDNHPVTSSPNPVRPWWRFWR